MSVDIVHISDVRLPIGQVTNTVTLRLTDGVDEVLILELRNLGTGMCRMVVQDADSGSIVVTVLADSGATKRVNLQQLPSRISFYVEAVQGIPVVRVKELTGAGAVLPGPSQNEPDDLNLYLGRSAEEVVPQWLYNVTVSPTDSVKDAIDALDFQSGAVGLARENYVVVNDVIDFPAPVAGVITLLANTVYEINGEVDIGTNRIDAGSCQFVRGLSSRVDKIITNNANALLTKVGTIQIEGLQLTNSGGPVLDCSGGGPGDTFVGSNLRFVGSASIGTLQDYAVISLRTILTAGCADGLTVDGSNGLLALGNQASFTNLGTFTWLTLLSGAAFTGVLLEALTIDSAAGQTALDIDPGVLLTGIGRVVNSSFTGAGTPLTGITKGEPRWLFKGNSGILDSLQVAELSFIGNATATVVPANNTFVDINPGAGGFSQNFLERLSEPSDGVVQYDGADDVTVIVNAIIMAQPSGMALDTWAARITRNAVPIFTFTTQFTKAGQPTALPITKALVLSPGDQVNVQITNVDGGGNLDIVVTSFIMLLGNIS